MDTLTFFTRVVAPVGHLVLAGLRASSGKFWNDGNFTAATAAARVAALDADPDVTVYFGVGTHLGNDTGPRVTRKKATAVWFKALALDLDCGPGKPYPTQKAGAGALWSALGAFGFPRPLLVSSGNGLHAYWPLIEPISTAHWEKASMALRLALAQHNVQVDWSKIHDASMVLRPVGSWHKKDPANPKLVTVLDDSPDYDAAVLATTLQQWIGKAPNSTKLSSSPLPSPRAPVSPLAANILGGSNLDPVNIDTMAKGCRQIAALLASGGATDAAGAVVAEPLWRASLGVAKYATDQLDAIRRLCGQHPDYDEQENLNKLAGWRGTGVTLCATFEQHCPAGCVGCPSKGQIKSPSSLSVTTQAIIPNPQPADPTATTAVPLPNGYFFRDGKTWQEVEVVVEDATGNKQTQMQFKKVCERRVIVFDRYTNHEKSEACVRWGFKQRADVDWRKHDLPMGMLMAGGAELMKYFGDRELIVGPMAMLVQLRTYMLSFLDYQQQSSDSGTNMESYGWQPDGTFLCGETLITRDGTVLPWRASKALISLSSKVGIRGDRAVWTDMTRLLDTADGYLIAFSMLVAGSGLLLQGSGIPSYVYSLYSEATGTGKSFSLQLGNSLSGHPTKQLLQAFDTENALYRIMGSMGSLSAAMDEITDMGDRAAGFAFQAQTGREKLRMDSSANVRKPVEWHAPLRLSTNTSILNMYDNKRMHNDAEQVRTLELQMLDKSWVSRQDMKGLTRLLADNHGFAAPEIAVEIMRRGAIRDVYDAASKQLDREFAPFTFEGDERFYAAAVTATYGIGCIGRDLGLFHFNIENCVETALDQIEKLRARRLGKQHDCFASIGQFLTEHGSYTLTLYDDPTAAVRKQRPVISFPGPTEIYARVEIVGVAGGQILPGSKLMINVARLREWAKKKGEDFSGLVDRLDAAGAVLQRREREVLSRGVKDGIPAQAYALILNLHHPQLANSITVGKPAMPTNTVVSILQGGKP